MGIGRTLAKKRQEQAREELTAQLFAQGLSEDEVARLSPFIDYYAENQVFPLIRNALIVLIILAVLGFIFAGFVGIFLGFMALMAALGAAAQYRHYSKATDLKRDLLANPQQFLTGTHPYPEIGEQEQEPTRQGRQPSAQQPPDHQPRPHQQHAPQERPQNHARNPQREQNEQ